MQLKKTLTTRRNCLQKRNYELNYERVLSLFCEKKVAEFAADCLWRHWAQINGAEILISRLQQPRLPWRRRLALLKVNAVLWLARGPGHEVLVQVTQCGSRTPRCSFARTAMMTDWAASRRQTGACASHSYWHFKPCARRHRPNVGFKNVGLQVKV